MFRTGLRILTRLDGGLQLGLDPEHSVHFEGLTQSEAQCLRLLEVPIEHHEFLTTAQDLGISIDRATSLLAKLRAAGVMDAGTTPGALSPDNFERLSCDADALAVHHGDGWSVLTGRSKATVAISGLGPLGVGIASILAGAGIGGFILVDEQCVLPSDLGRGGYCDADLGQLRKTVATQRIKSIAPNAMIIAEDSQLPDILVAVEYRVADALTYQPLMHAGVTHLSVVIREGNIRLGPMVRPGFSTCTRCVDLHLTDQDEQWPRLAAQVAGSTWANNNHEETLCAATASALAAGQILTEIQGGLPTTVGATLEIGLPQAIPEIRQWPPHPRCSCG